MSKIKKIFAVLLTLAMVLGMSMTTFAADKTATITINNAGSTAKFQYVQVIEPDTTTVTGWKFSNAAIEASYLTAYDATDAQTVIAALIKGGDAAKTQAALDAVLSTQTLSAVTASPITVTKAGVYAIKGEETGYAYSSMAAYISFENYNASTGVPQTLKSTTIEAKRVPTTVIKTNDDEDKVVEIGREVTYNVETTVPYIAANVSNPKYIITDTISGAKYALNADGDLEVSVKIGANAATTYKVTPTVNTEGKETFTLDLSQILTGNKDANNKLVLTYKAIVTDTLIGNTVKAGDGENDTKYGTDYDKLVTGEITLTKTGENKALLAGAKFVVYKEVEGTKNYAKFDANNKFVAWTTNKAEATKVVTGEDGAVKVEGLDAGATYKFEEVEAPEGYSINATDSVATWGTVDEKLEETVKGTASMTDTKLSALPGTGGIGTTIFTVGGCLIMIAAAALFFESRKKHTK